MNWISSDPADKTTTAREAPTAVGPVGEISVQTNGDLRSFDVADALSSDRLILTAAIVNPNDESQLLTLRLTVGELTGRTDCI